MPTNFAIFVTFCHSVKEERIIKKKSPASPAFAGWEYNYFRKNTQRERSEQWSWQALHEYIYDFNRRNLHLRLKVELTCNALLTLAFDFAPPPIGVKHQCIPTLSSSEELRPVRIHYFLLYQFACPVQFHFGWWDNHTMQHTRWIGITDVKILHHLFLIEISGIPFPISYLTEFCNLPSSPAITSHRKTYIKTALSHKLLGTEGTHKAGTLRLDYTEGFLYVRTCPRCHVQPRFPSPFWEMDASATEAGRELAALIGDVTPDPCWGPRMCTAPRSKKADGCSSLSPGKQASSFAI